MISDLVDGDLGTYVRFLVETASALYSRGSQTSYLGCDPANLQRICCFSGSKVLQILEAALSNTSLAKASVNQLKALFLSIFGATVAVGYTNPTRDLGDVSGSQIGQGSH